MNVSTEQAQEARHQEFDRKPLIAVLSATGLAWFGNILSMIVVPWLVYETTGSGALTGVVGFAAALPLVISGMFGGVLVDRIGHARVAVIAEVFSGLFLALIPILHLTVGLSVPAIAALVFISNIFSSPAMTARRALIPELAPQAGMPLERANSIEQMLSRFPQLLGPAAAGALIVVLHPANVIWLTVAIVWLAGLVLFLGVPMHRHADTEEPGSYLTDLKAGFQFVMQDRLIRSLAFILAFTNLLEAPLSIIAPVYAQDVLGSSVGLGIIMGALALGLMLGVALFAWFGHRLPRRTVFIVGLCGIGVSYWLLATLPGLWMTSTILFTLGVLAGPVNPLLSTIFQERVPANMRGRVFGLIAAIALSMLPVGRLVGGALIDWIGLSGILVVQASGFAIAGVVMILLPSLKLLNERQPVAETVVSPATTQTSQ